MALVNQLPVAETLADETHHEQPGAIINGSNGSQEGTLPDDAEKQGIHHKQDTKILSSGLLDKYLESDGLKETEETPDDEKKLNDTTGITDQKVVGVKTDFSAL